MDNLIKLLGYFFGQREFLLGDDMESRVADVAHDRLFVVDGVGFDRRQRLFSDSIKTCLRITPGNDYIFIII